MTSFLKMIDKQNNDEFSEHTRICLPMPPYGPPYPWFWNVNRYRPKRPLRTVIIDRNQMDTLMAQVRCFLSSAGVRWYRQKGFPL